MKTPTPVIIQEDDDGYRATWFSDHVYMAVIGKPGETHQEALRNLANALDNRRDQLEVLNEIDSTP